MKALFIAFTCFLCISCTCTAVDTIQMQIELVPAGGDYAVKPGAMTTLRIILRNNSTNEVEVLGFDYSGKESIGSEDKDQCEAIQAGYPQRLLLRYSRSEPVAQRHAAPKETVVPFPFCGPISPGSLVVSQIALQAPEEEGLFDLDCIALPASRRAVMGTIPMGTQVLQAHEIKSGRKKESFRAEGSRQRTMLPRRNFCVKRTEMQGLV